MITTPRKDGIVMFVKFPPAWGAERELVSIRHHKCNRATARNKGECQEIVAVIEIGSDSERPEECSTLCGQYGQLMCCHAVR